MLQNHFLIAMPSLQPSDFQQTLIYLCEHNTNGAIGIIINRPTDLHLQDVLKEMYIPIMDTLGSNPVLLCGGPIHQERGFVLHSVKGNWRSTLATSEDIFVTTSRDILEALVVQNGPPFAQIALGCATWETGQLEQEIKDNYWLTVTAKPAVIFDTPCEQRYAAALAMLGIDVANLSYDVGHD